MTETEKNGSAAVGTHAFPCHSCGNRMIYSPGTGGLVCSYCRAEREIKAPRIEAPEYLYNEHDERAAAPDWDAEGSVTVVCPSCGAETVAEAEVMTVTCAFCGSHYVTEPRKALPILRPETMIPHKIPGERANALFSGWVKNRYFAPRAFRRARHTPDMKGVYLPFFTFDTDMTTGFSGQGGRRRTVVYTVRVNGKTQTRTRTVVDWYPVAGDRTEYFDDTPFCASRSVDERMLKKLGPFSLKNLNVYDPAYLAGFFAERYTLGLGEGFSRVKPEVERRMQHSIEASLGYDTYRLMQYRHNYNKISFKHILLPVWISSYRFRGKVYRFMVNGETGRVAGKAPVSPFRVALAVLAAIGLCALAFWLFTLVGEAGATMLLPESETAVMELAPTVEAALLPPPM